MGRVEAKGRPKRRADFDLGRWGSSTSRTASQAAGLPRSSRASKGLGCAGLRGPLGHGALKSGSLSSGAEFPHSFRALRLEDVGVVPTTAP